MKDIKSILYSRISPYLLKIYEPFIAEIIAETTLNSVEYPEKLEQFFKNKIENYLAQIVTIRTLWNEKEKLYYSTDDDNAKNKIILEFCKSLGANDDELKNDAEAFNRWFDFDAVLDRAREKISYLERNICFLIERSSYLENISVSMIDYFVDLSEKYNWNSRINDVALKLILDNLVAGGRLSQESTNNVLKNIEYNEIDTHRRVNYIKLLSILDPKKFIKYCSEYSSNIGNQDDIFVREDLVSVFKNISDNKLAEELISLTIKDSSSFVKQSLCDYLRISTSEKAYQTLELIILDDKAQTVQATAFKNLTDRIITEKNFQIFFEITVKTFKKIKSEFVLRFALTEIQRAFTEIKDQALNLKYVVEFKKLINLLLKDNIAISVKRLAIETNLSIFIITNLKLQNCKIKLEQLIGSTEIGQHIEILDPEINSLAIDELGKLLCLIAKHEFDLEFWSKDGIYIISRGVKMRFRLWRFLHEIFISIPDKRQNHSHTVGRIFHGENLVLSNMAELAETQIPGEPLYISEEKSVRPFLPLPDYCLSVIDSGKEAHIFSAEGITTVTPPQGLVSRYYAKLMLSWKFKKVAKLRNWRKGIFWHADSYINKLNEFGLKINFSPYKGEEGLPETKNFFKTLSIFPFFGSFSNIKEYFLSPHSNSLSSLGIFIFLVIILWGGKHYLSYQKHKNNRKKIPLVVGGWGTRGKTGVERLKATLFNTMGLKVVSKTTGCEAILVIADPYQHIHEIPIIRPYDETTIWEQRKVVNFAQELKAEVFLWECMALRPAYVDIMQNEWMKDDISTLTNAHPDHEDIQGPAGIDIAHSISSFIRENGSLITSEEQMLPIFKEKARLRNTEVKCVNWQNVGLVPEDILNLFPYYEHPNNIALVCSLAEEFGISKNVTFKAMINNVVEDIGALKAFPICNVHNRKIQFINGMSANEEVGCVNNWKRLGFDDCDLATHSATFVSTVVNNRSDRVRRSRVFAEIVANVLCADRHFLIGNNLTGLKNYIIKAWRKNLEDLIHLMKISDPLLLLDRAFIRLHICITESDRDKRLQAIESFENNKDKIACENFTKEFTQEYEEYIRLKKLIEGQSNFPEEEIRESLTNIFLKKIVIIDEDKNSPDEIISKVAEHTPPGFLHKIMGIQNIKSPGIGLIKAWQQWEICYKACNNLLSKDKSKIEKALFSLSKFQAFYSLSKEYVRSAITNLKQSGDENNSLIIEKIVNALGKDYIHEKPSKLSFFSSIFSEIMLVKTKMRQKQIYEQIYEDLASKRISFVKAAQELGKFMER